MSNTHTFLLPSHTNLGGPLHPDRTDKTVFKTSLKSYSSSIMEGSEMLMCCAFPYIALPWLGPCATSQTVNLNILILIYCQLRIGGVTRYIIKLYHCQWCTLLIPRRLLAIKLALCLCLWVKHWESDVVLCGVSAVFSSVLNHLFCAVCLED